MIEEDEKLNNNHVLLHELPNDIMHKICNNLLDKNDKRFNKIFNESNDYKLLKIVFGNNIPSRKQLIYIEPNIFNEYKTNINLDCIKEYINKNKKFNKLNCHSLQIVYRVNNNINLSTFLIRILDENNNKVGRINNSCKVSFKFKDNDKEEFLCDEECQNVMISITDEIKDLLKVINVNQIYF